MARMSGVWPDEPSSDFGDVFDGARRRKTWAEATAEALAWIRQAQPSDWEALRPEERVMMQNVLGIHAGPEDWKAFSPEQRQWFKDALGIDGCASEIVA